MGYYNGGWSLILIAIAEVAVFAWIYGKQRHIRFIDIERNYRLQADD